MMERCEEKNFMNIILLSGGSGKHLWRCLMMCVVSSLLNCLRMKTITNGKSELSQPLLRKEKTNQALQGWSER